MPDYPKRGRGRRYLDCEVYGACLEIAAVERWENFNCEGCPNFEEGQKGKSMSIEDKKPTKLCETCGQKPTIQPTSTECASCMAKRSHKKKKARGRPPKNTPKQLTRPTLESRVVVDFGKHGDILGQVARLADEELRTPELEIIHLLKEHLNAAQKGVEAR